MSARGLRISQFALTAAFAGLGVWSFAKGDSVGGGIYLVASVGWLSIAVFKDR